MNNHQSEDRGMMKWAPFYSVLSENEIKTTVENKEIYSKPDLSEDQIMELENIIIEAYNNNKGVKIKIYDNRNFITKEGIINKLDTVHKAIYLNKKMILFSNIIDIKII